MKTITLDIASEGDMERLGRALAGLLPHGATVCLNGPLGAGKTRLVQAVAVARGVSRSSVVSPTFTLCNEYPGDPGIAHLDLYRIADEDELLELGIEEYFAAPTLTFVEWADRFPELMPPERWEVSIEFTSAASRRLTITAHGPENEAALERLAHSMR